MTEQETKFCKDSLAIQTHRIFPKDVNEFGTLFGGELLALIDDTASISASRHCRLSAMTAAADKIDFIKPLKLNHAVSVQSYVSGVGTRSMEVFSKVMGEDLITGERYLAATSFLTFVILCRDQTVTVPNVAGETAEENFVISGYEGRRAQRVAQRQFNQEFDEQVLMKAPWLISQD